MTETPSADDYDRTTSEHRMIRRLIEIWDGTPAATVDQSGRDVPVIVFGDPDEGVEPVKWGAFFDRLESNDLALAYRTGDAEADGTPPSCAFVPRDGRPEADASERPDDGVIDKHDEGVSDRRSQIREREAEKRTNPDNHRDRRPFQN